MPARTGIRHRRIHQPRAIARSLWSAAAGISPAGWPPGLCRKGGDGICPPDPPLADQAIPATPAEAQSVRRFPPRRFASRCALAQSTAGGADRVQQLDTGRSVAASGLSRPAGRQTGAGRHSRARGRVSRRQTPLAAQKETMTRRLATPRKTRTESPLQVRLTHPDRVIFSEPDITKRDLASYYNQASEWILPHVADRPLSLVRCPAGTSGQCFFQKHPPEGLPAVVKRIEIREKEGVNTYLTISNVEGLVTLVQFRAIEIHPGSARFDDVDKPDRLIFDLDPDPAVDWPAVVEAALLFRRVFADLGLVAFVKTTGGKGLHVVIPVDRRRDWKTVKSFCKSTAERVAAAAPAQYTTNPLKAHRRGKIFIDYLR